MTTAESNETFRGAPARGLTFKQAVGDRRTIRFFQAYRPVEPEKVQAVLEACRLQSVHGNAGRIRKAVVVHRAETDPGTWADLNEALYNQPAAAQAPCHIYWTLDMNGWKPMRKVLLELLDTGALSPSYGWSEQFIDDIVMKTPDFNVMSGDRTFAEWLSAFECGLGVGAALLAAVDEGLGTSLLTGVREKLAKTLGLPEDVTVTQVQLLGYPAEEKEAGGQRPRPDFEELYFSGQWGNPLTRDDRVSAQLAQSGMLQAPAPLPYRKHELRSLAAMFGLPE